MHTYNLPVEPPVGAWLQAKDGTIWEHQETADDCGYTHNRWREQLPASERSRSARNLSWKEMLIRNGAIPLTEIAPPEPPVGTRLRDRDGNIWRHTTNTLWEQEQPRIAACPIFYRDNWAELYEQRSPFKHLAATPPEIGDSRFNAPEWLNTLPDLTAIITREPRTNITRVWRKDGLTWYCANIASDICTSEEVTEGEYATIIWLPKETK